MRCAPAVVALVVLLAVVGCGDEGAGSDASTTALTQQQTTTEEQTKPEDKPTSEVKCDSPEKVVCTAGEEVYGPDLLTAVALQQGGGLAITYSVSDADPSRMEDLYGQVFGSGIPIKYVGIAAFKPGDVPGKDFPQLDTNVGADLYALHRGEPFSDYWRVLSGG